MRLLLIFGVVLALPLSVAAQDGDQTLADIRQDLTVLNVEVQRLRRELSTTGGSGAVVGSGSLLDRVQVIEAELTRLTSKTEQLEHRITRIVADGTNRIGDLEFRLVELEGGDVSQLGETSTLGGEAPAPAPAEPVPLAPEGDDGPQLALSEEEDFRRAEAALAAGDNAAAEEGFRLFNETYPGGPLGPAASLGRGKALEAMGDTREAARAYLNAYSAAPDGSVAPSALLHLGRALNVLGQLDAACQTLSEVEVKFPQAAEVTEAQAEMQRLSCF